MAKVAGLHVAYLAGAPSPAHAKALIEDINKSLGGDIDLLLTSEWPAGATRLSACAPGVALPPLQDIRFSQAAQDQGDGCRYFTFLAGDAPEGLEEVTAVVQAARPRYHFTCSESVFFQREPYMNSDRGAGAHATRLISLGAVGNGSKAKWMHALALDPVEGMSVKDLCSKPPQSTECPYRQNNNLKKRKVRSYDPCRTNASVGLSMTWLYASGFAARLALRWQPVGSKGCKGPCGGRPEQERVCQECSVLCGRCGCCGVLLEGRGSGASAAHLHFLHTAPADV